MAMCTYLLQKYAGLTFNEATTYLWTCQLYWPQANLGKSRQAVYGLRKSALKKIEACEKPVLDMIKPYVDCLRLIWID